MQKTSREPHGAPNLEECLHQNPTISPRTTEARCLLPGVLRLKTHVFLRDVSRGLLEMQRTTRVRVSLSVIWDRHAGIPVYLHPPHAQAPGGHRPDSVAFMLGAQRS